MRIHSLPALIFLFAAAASTPGAAEEVIEADHVRIRWLAPEHFGADGGPVPVGIHFELDPHWHVYWRNAGDSGAAPRFDITSEQADISGPRWPFPQRLPVAHLTNFGYDEEVAYVFELTPENVESGMLRLKADLEWLVCKVDCIPGFGTLTLERPAGGGRHEWNRQVRETLKRFEVRTPGEAADSPWRIERAVWSSDGGRLTLDLSAPGKAPVPELFPVDGGRVQAAAPEVEGGAGTLKMHFKTVAGAEPPASLHFVLASGGRAWAFPDIQPVRAAAADGATGGSGEAIPLWILLLSAFAGGVILNLMPCVFPVLSIKLFSLIRAGDAGRPAGAHRLREGLLYTAGVLATFAALGGAFLALRAAGAAVGWGFQLQSPAVILALALLFWLMGLSFAGAFEFGQSLVRLAGRGGGGSSFSTGILAVFVATPCTGPFMGTALGAAATLPAAQAMAVFIGLGAGLAAPFLLLAASPALHSRLPRPGPWMETLKQFLAFPLFATVLWLLWVLAELVGEDGWLLGGALLLAVSFAVWLARLPRRRWRVAALVVALAALMSGFQHLATLETPEGRIQTAGAWQPYDAGRIADARERGQAVFVDFTAAWCVTCQVNKKAVLETPAAERLFDAHDVLLIRADWTRRDPAITRALAALGRNSVPVYLFYPAGGGEPELLPQVLSMEVLRDLFES